MNLRAANFKFLGPNRLLWALAALTLIFCVSSGALHAQQQERAVRAAFVYNLTKYVSWPQTRDRLNIGIVGEGNMGAVLKQVLEGKTTEGRKIAVLIHPTDSEIRDCDVLYIAELSPARIQSVLSRIHGRSILTVGETEQFARAGGMVGLVRSGDQIQVEINSEAVRSGKLQMSSRLLNLAVLVRSSGGTP